MVSDANGLPFRNSPTLILETPLLRSAIEFSVNGPMVLLRFTRKKTIFRNYFSHDVRVV